MAYMNQEKKKAIVARVRKVLPKGWKCSFRVRNYSTLVMTIQSAPIDLVQIAIDNMNANKSEEDMAVYGDDFIHKNEGYLELNEYHLESYFQGDLLDTFRKIRILEITTTAIRKLITLMLVFIHK